MGQRLDNAKALYLEAIRDGNAAEAIEKYSGMRYTQHSTPVKDGKEGFKEFFAEFHERNPVRDIEIVRSFEDGRFVFLHVVQNLNDGEFMYVTADIFDTDDNAKLIEHWDIIQEIVPETVSGHTQVDGPTEPVDVDKTLQNKRLVRNFMNDVVKNGDLTKLADYISTESYVQHNPNMADGIEGIAAYLGEHGSSMEYPEVHNVIGCGSLVAVLAKMTQAGKEYATINLFRVADDRLVEHWDVVEEILPEDQWVNLGKF